MPISKRLLKIYSLRDDTRIVKAIQHATLHTEDAGLRSDHGLVGSKDWWRAIDQGLILRKTVEGVISRVYMSGHGDFPEFEVTSGGSDKTNWARKGDDKYYIQGREIRVIYVLQEFKQPLDIRGGNKKERISHDKLVLEIWVEES